MSLARAKRDAGKHRFDGRKEWRDDNSDHTAI